MALPMNFSSELAKRPKAWPQPVPWGEQHWRVLPNVAEASCLRSYKTTTPEPSIHGPMVRSPLAVSSEIDCTVRPKSAAAQRDQAFQIRISLQRAKTLSKRRGQAFKSET